MCIQEEKVFDVHASFPAIELQCHSPASHHEVYILDYFNINDQSTTMQVSIFSEKLIVI